MPELPGQTPTEAALRRRLGVPDEARHVLILAESSHWDPNWLHTSEEYFARYVRRNLDQALAALQREPRRVYSVECLFFLQMYWERRPEQRDAVRTLANAGRLRLTSSGITTADTLLPHPEAILRDLLLGQEWLRAHGMEPEPRLAYFPDSFGCSHALPSLLNAAGFDRTAITRVDGMFFAGCELGGRRFPRPGSSAELLLKKERSLDFVWRDADGGEVLCHWNAYTYGQGDLLAHGGFSRVYILPIAWPRRSDRHVAGRIDQYARELQPYARTPYLFCPIGFDFVGPIPELVALLDRYNQRHYRRSGIWAVNAGLDDYLALVDAHRERLPTLQLDPNPYWTGFYSARPSLKRQSHELVEALLLAEQLALRPENAGAAEHIAQELAAAWQRAVVANHHDFITGTATDRVVEREQRPCLAAGAEIAAAAIARLERAVPSPAAPRPAAPPQWRQHGGTVEIHTPHYSLELDAAAGGAIVRAWDPASGQKLLEGPSADLVAYADSGGLWRMGHEFPGGTFREIDRASRRPAQLQVREEEGSLEVTTRVELAGMALERRLLFRGDTPVIELQVRGRAAPRRTVTLQLATGLATERLAMDEPGGVVVRPAEKGYRPTFWPGQTFVHLQGAGRGAALFLETPGAVACRPGGRLEVITQRNATQETAYGFLRFPGLPVRGHERAVHTARCGLLLTPGGDWQANDLPRRARLALEGTDRARFAALAASWIEVDGPGVYVVALKPAARGEGLIVRLLAPGQRGQAVAVRLPGTAAAYRCDARERDLEPLAVRGGAVHLTMPGSIATLRLLLQP